MTNQGIKQQKRHIHISSKHKWFDLKLKEVWRYRDLIWLFTKRSFTVTYKQTVLGPAWLFLNPIITSLIYAFVFGGIAYQKRDYLYVECGRLRQGVFPEIDDADIQRSVFRDSIRDSVSDGVGVSAVLCYHRRSKP